MSTEESYRILQIPPGASHQDIKRAYRTQAKLFHPDVNRSLDAQKQFVLVNQAYEKLLPSKPETIPSRVYDMYRGYDPFRGETRQERAARFARMQYEEFKRNNEKFRNSIWYIPIKIFAYFVWLMGGFVAVGFMVGPFLMMFVNWMTGVSMLPIIFMGIAVMTGVFRLKNDMNQYLNK
ncbi:J domain-containing protein [Rhodocytophaga rosea]|uniref:J domain-containing protein n=1 Tax=Rhodocytophaga rosea TaxID=2704465 RepID=A0A6C0GR97_9BACT|nr:J domain-containing protein [Rhodocytophaga rosea]QHT70586.1 J domain-containing protein [Rhodocytophaga rosea]